MVKKIRKKKTGAQRRQQREQTWWVPFDKEGNAALYIHKHGDTDDHSGCGPVVMCCDRVVAPYRSHAPELHETVDVYRAQNADHLSSWFDSGVGAMYFVLCDDHNPNGGYQFGLPANEAREVLYGNISTNGYKTESTRFANQ